MERDVKGLCLVLKTENTGERDRLLTLFSPSLGMLRCRVYGAQKSKKAAQRPLYSEGNFSLYSVPEKHQWSYKDSDIIAERHEILEDLDRTVAASLFSELIMTSRSEDPYLYELISGAFDRLTVGEDWRRVTISFVVKFLSFFGTLPGFSECPVCQKVYDEREVLGYNDREGTPCCSACDTAEGAMLLPPNARRFLGRTLEVEFGDTFLLGISEVMTERIFRYVLRLLMRSYPTGLKTLSSGLWSTV